MKFCFTTSLLPAIMAPEIFERTVPYPMTIEELVPGINIEDVNTEFKGILEEGDNQEVGWLKTLAAFSNTDGGKLYVGVENKTHKVLALDHTTADKVSLMVNRQIRNRLQPVIPYDIQAIPVRSGKGSRYVLEVTVSKSSEVPVYLHADGLLGVYIRLFGETVLASPEQIRDMILMSEQVPYDRPLTDADFSEEDFSSLFHYASENKIRLSAKTLVSGGFMSGDKKLSKGALLFSDHPQNEKTKVVATVWPGLDKGSSLVLASKEFFGGITAGIQFATEFVYNHSVTGFRKETGGRIAVYSYPERAVLEGVVNAFAHRNYFLDGTQIEINIFKDRLEITSPGSLPGVRQLQHETDIASIMPRRRNEVVCNVLVLLHLMESKGSGFDKIEEDYRAAAEKQKPFVTTTSDSFTLTLPDLTYAGGVVAENDPNISVYTDALMSGKHDLAILAFCYRQAHSAKEIAEKLGLKPSTYFRKNVIAPLVEKGYLQTDNSARAERYIANKEKVFVK